MTEKIKSLFGLIAMDFTWKKEGRGKMRPKLYCMEDRSQYKAELMAALTPQNVERSCGTVLWKRVGGMMPRVAFGSRSFMGIAFGNTTL